MPDGRVTGLSYFLGGEFTRHAEVTFLGHPGKLVLKQQFSGIDEHGHLTIDTELEGRVPQIPYGASVHIEPYTELYHYSSSGRSQTGVAGQPVSLRVPSHCADLEFLAQSVGSVLGSTESFALISFSLSTNRRHT